MVLWGGGLLSSSPEGDGGLCFLTEGARVILGSWLFLHFTCYRSPHWGLSTSLMFRIGGNRGVAFAGVYRHAVGMGPGTRSCLLVGGRTVSGIRSICTRCWRRYEVEGVILGLKGLEWVSVWLTLGSLLTTWFLQTVNLWSESGLKSLL